MTTYRRLQSGLLRAAVDSVLAQTHRDFEFIICDDASTDGTADYLQSVAAADARVKVIRNRKNVNSVAVSLGRCFKQADPARAYVTWMFDDCTLQPDAFETLAGRMAQSNLDFVFGVTRVHNPDGSILLVGNESVSAIRDRIATSSILVPNGAILCRRAIFERVGWYDSNIVMRRSCDWDLFRRMIEANCSFETVAQVLMDEYGGLQSDSLRNSFTTTFDIMSKFVRLRDAGGFDVSVDASLNAPIDLVPPGDWSADELTLIYAMFVEYHLSVGNVTRAYFWAERLNLRLPDKPFFFENLAACVSAGDRAQSLMAAGALAAGTYWTFRENQQRRA
jgi:glycosyltransferase involved in cell wall biosynthesis